MSARDRVALLAVLLGATLVCAVPALAQDEAPQRNWAIIVDSSGSMAGNPKAAPFIGDRLAPALISDDDSVVMFNFDAKAYGTGPASPNLIFVESAAPKDVAAAVQRAPWPLSKAQGTARKWAVVQAMEGLDRVRKLGPEFGKRQNIIVAVTDTDVDSVTPAGQLTKYRNALGSTLQYLGELRDARPRSRLKLMLWAYAPAGCPSLTNADKQQLLNRAQKCFPPPGRTGGVSAEDLIEGRIVSARKLKCSPSGKHRVEFELTSSYESDTFAGGVATSLGAVKWDTGKSPGRETVRLSGLTVLDAESADDIELEPMHTGDIGAMESDTVRLSADLNVGAKPPWWDPRAHTLQVTVILEPEDAYLFAAPVAGPNRLEKAKLFGIETRPYDAELVRGTISIAYPFNWRPLAYLGAPLILLIALLVVGTKGLRKRPVPLYFHVAGSDEPWAQRNVLPKTPTRIGSQFASPGKDVVEVTQTKEGLIARPLGDAVLLNEAGGECGGVLAIVGAGAFQVQTTVFDTQGNEKRDTIAFEYSREPVMGGPGSGFDETLFDSTTGETFQEF